MQRRQQLHPNQPYISLPSHNSPTMGSLSFSSPSSSSRRGKTHLALSVLHPPPPITLIHFLLSHLLIDTKLLQRRSKSQKLPQLKRTCQPFDFCPSYSPGDKIGTKYGTVTLSKSRMHLGSGARIQRVLNKALAGQSVTISVLGGSGILFPSSFHTPKLNIRTASQCQHTMVQGTTLYSLHAIHPASSSGGTPPFPTQLQN